MKHRIHHSLDRTASIFGIRGRYLAVMAAGAGMSCVIGLAVGQATQLILGIAALFACCIAAYLGVILLQSRIDHRDFMKALHHGMLPRFWSTRPSAMRNIWKGIN